MKVLVINHPEADFGGAFIYNGLCELLGAENVYDYPIKYSYHGVDHKYSTPSIENGFTSPFPWMPQHAVAWSAEAQADHTVLCEEMRRMILSGQFDLCLVESCRVIAMTSFLRFEKELRSANTPLVLHEGEDFHELCTREINIVKPRLHLKREMRASNPQRMDDVSIIPFPFSFPDCAKVREMLANSDGGLHWDVTLMCGSTWPEREDALRALSTGVGSATRTLLASDKPDKFGESTINNLMPWVLYMRNTARSKMGVSIRGYGHDTCRFWEVAATTLLLTGPLDLVIPFPYEHGVNCLKFGSTSELLSLVEQFSKSENDARLAELRTACMEHTRDFHTNAKRVEWMLGHAGLTDKLTEHLHVRTNAS